MNYDGLIAQASEYAPADISIDMCRHESVIEPTFWLFRNGSQIGCAAHEPGGAMPWRAVKMHRGMPYAEKRFLTIDQAIRFAGVG